VTNPRSSLLDVEGTTSSIRFVYDVMFPFVRRNLVDYLDHNWDSPALQQCLPLLAADIGQTPESWLDEDATEAQSQVARAVTRLMDSDVKATGLKKLQGAIWKNGFESGELVAHVYDDVEPAIRKWKADGIDVRIYSSGSVEAQQLFFGHCLAGNLLELLTAHYDTTMGAKIESSSYAAIAADAGFPAGEMLFVSDVVQELEAAGSAGMQTVLSVRPGNQPAPDWGGRRIRRFDEIEYEVPI